MKHFSALFTALIITAIIGLGIVVIGVSALTNTNTVSLQNSPRSNLNSNDPTGASNNSAGSIPSSSTDIHQLQQQVDSLQSQLGQANHALQQYQSLLMALQQRGVLYIDQTGNIYLPGGSSEDSH
jgi:hypothetical protein